ATPIAYSRLPFDNCVVYAVMISSSPVASLRFDRIVRRPRRPPKDTLEGPDCRRRLGFPCESDWISSSVAVCTSCDSLRATPNSLPCVKTLWPLCAPNPPCGANVTLLLSSICSQFDGTLTRNTLPALNVR